MKTVFHMALEPIETRYTAQWLEVIPKELMKRDVRVWDILGETKSATIPTNGAFLNFAATNIWKSEQVIYLAELIADGKVKDGDHIFWPDAWHTGTLQAKYMIELLGLDVKMSGYWHAGSYDPQDFLGRLIKDKRWSFNTERAVFYALDYNFFATEFHIDMFCKALHIERDKTIVRTGQPHNKLIESITTQEKRDLILFPHRVAPEKQVDIFLDLARCMPEYEWVVCQDRRLSKEEYHNLLGQSKMVFSANLQETLGISAMEAILAGSAPLLPDRLSYSEMYDKEFLYPSKWTLDWDHYVANRPGLIQRVKKSMNGRTSEDMISIQRERLIKDYLTAGKMFDIIGRE